MERWLRWLVMVLSWIGAATILCAIAIGALVLLADHEMASACKDTEQVILKSPDGKQTIRAFHEECSTYRDYTVELSSGLTGFGVPRYISIAEFYDVGPGQVSVAWNGSSEVDITYPKSAKIGNVSAKMRGVRIVLKPPL